MKKVLIFSGFLAICILLLSGCMNSNKQNKSLEQKANTEISYIDSELISIANELNDINYANYKLDVQEIQIQAAKTEDSKSEQGSDKQESEGKNSKERGKEEGENGSGRM